MRRTIFEPEHEDFRESVRGFLRKEAVPKTQEWEAAGVIDRAFWRKAAAQGFVGFSAPEEHGGLGLDDFRFNAVIDEECAYTGAATDNFALVNDIVVPYLHDLTDESQRARWLPGVTAGELVPVIAMTEPGTGSDLRAISSTATWDGSAYRLSGSKTFVSSGIQADLVIVAARTGEGLSLLAVPAGAELFTRGL
jgi:alkylation response protein AidB-like acyl-CoA dehydrogenase